MIRICSLICRSDNDAMTSKVPAVNKVLNHFCHQMSEELLIIQAFQKLSTLIGVAFPYTRVATCVSLRIYYLFACRSGQCRLKVDAADAFN